MVDVNGQTGGPADPPPAPAPELPSTPSPAQHADDKLDTLRRAPFGSRYLTDPNDVFSFNAWDHVVPPPEWEDEARQTLAKQRESKVSREMKWAYNNKPAVYWDRFYNLNKGSFFKDRNWLKLEFPELVECAKAEAGPKLVVEIGCGAGNTVFPLLKDNLNPHLVVHACDYSKSAVEVVKAHDEYPRPSHGRGILHASVWDVTAQPVVVEASEGAERTERPSLPEGVEEGSVDVATLIFVMSALHPTEWQRAVANCYKMLKPNGLLMIRDYGRFDLAQLRVKKGRMLEENFYIRGDGTRVYFFEAAELSEMLTGSKTAYTPMPVSSTTVEDPADSAQTPEGGKTPSVPGTPLDESAEAGIASALHSLSVSPAPDAVGGTVSGAGTGAASFQPTATPASTSSPAGGPSPPLTPLSTRFRPPPADQNAKAGPSHHPLPRDAYPEIHVPTSDKSEVPEDLVIDPFEQTPEELDVPPHPLFVIDQLGIDRRMMVNRKRQLKMYRIWMQVKARKLVSSPEDESART